MPKREMRLKFAVFNLALLERIFYTVFPFELNRGLYVTIEVLTLKMVGHGIQISIKKRLITK